MSHSRAGSNAPISVPSYSSSPSKSSLRRTSGGTAPRSLLPSPHFHEPVISASYDSPEAEIPHPLDAAHESSQYDDQTAAAPQPAQPFQPFFALIEDTATREHYHPTVHYIFADDEADIITEAALRSLEQNQPRVQDSSTVAESRAQEPQSQESEQQHEQAARYLAPVRPNVREHYLILDVSTTAPTTQHDTAATEAVSEHHQTGASTSIIPVSDYEVTSAQSLSADWAVLHTSISQAPTLGDQEGDEGLMLRIEGRGGMVAEEVEGGSVEEMIERFERGLEEVRGLIDAQRDGQGEERVEQAREGEE